MSLIGMFDRINRLIAKYSGSHRKISYLKSLGVKIGNNCKIETLSFSTEPYLIEIGNNVGVSNGTVFITHDAGIRCFRDEFPEDDIFGKIIIGDNVFVGMNCTFLPNTYIGNNSIIGAGSVVRGKFPDNSVIVGNPAKVLIGMAAQRMLYRLNPDRLTTGQMSDPEKKPHVLKHFNQKKLNSFT